MTTGIPRRPAGAPTPLSFAQARMWFFAQMEPESSAYHITRVTRWTGPLDSDVMERSLAEVVRRHEALRTCFPAKDGSAEAVVAPADSFRLALVDATDLPAPERSARALEWVKEETRRPFDLARGPVFRATLLRIDPTEHLLVLVTHHIVTDGWSNGIVMRELAAIYPAFAAGRGSPLPELPIQYGDYACWQRERLAGPMLTKELGYWRGRLGGAPALLDLPTDRPRPARQAYKGGRVVFTLGTDLVQAITVLSRGERTTPYMLLLAGFQLLLSRVSGQPDVLVGTPVAGRVQAQLEALIGCFVTSLVLRTNLAGDPTFRELLGRVRETALGAYSHQELPFERLVDELRVERTFRFHPLFQVLFNFRNYPGSSPEIPGFRIEEVEIEGSAARFDLDLGLQTTREGMRGVLTYDTDIFDRESALHLAEQFQALLEQIVTSPDHRVGAYSLRTERARELLPDPRDPLPEPHFRPVTEMVAEVAQGAPDRCAIRQGERGWTYGELAAQAGALAQTLRARGVARGEALALVGSPSFGLIVGMLAVLSCGAVLLPVAPELPPRRKRLMLEQAGARRLLQVGAGDTGLEGNDSAPIEILLLDEDTGCCVVGSPGLGDHISAAPFRPEADDPAYIFYTSGTTGTPKGVLGVHKGLSHFLTWQREQFQVGPADRCAQLTGISFDVVLRDVFLPLSSGATLYLPPADLMPERVITWLGATGITLLHAVPSLSTVWLDHCPAEAALPALRWIFLAGEPLTDVLVHRWRGLASERCGIANLYGPTETTLAKCCYVIPDTVAAGSQPVGRPLTSTQALVMANPDRLCGINEPGEIVVRTPFRTRGYVNSAEEQASRFVANPYSGLVGDLLYRTGDLGRYRTDGMLMVLGRLDQQVKIRGVRIEPQEVAAVLDRHPEVQGCAVVPTRHEGQPPALIAYVVADPDRLSAMAVHAFLAERLPAALVPSAVVFLERLPVTANGKLDRAALPAPADQTAPRHAFVAPRTPVEELLSGIWSEVLHVAPVGIHDNFFELGGHSLLATQVVARVRAATTIDLSLWRFFQAPTVAGLGRMLEEANGKAVAHDDEAERLLAEVEALSADTAEQLLAISQEHRDDPDASR